MSEEYKRNPNTQCLICGKRIYKRPREIEINKGNVFCSSACFGKSCRKEIPCTICGKLILSSLNKKTCSRTCANKNRIGIQYKTNETKDKVKHSRLLRSKLYAERGAFCERCGYSTKEILQIHHRNRDRDDNKLTNLELLCPNCHSLEHYTNQDKTLKKPKK